MNKNEQRQIRMEKIKLGVALLELERQMNLAKKKTGLPPHLLLEGERLIAEARAKLQALK